MNELKTLNISDLETLAETTISDVVTADDTINHFAIVLEGHVQTLQSKAADNQVTPENIYLAALDPYHVSRALIRLGVKSEALNTLSKKLKYVVDIHDPHSIFVTA